MINFATGPILSGLPCGNPSLSSPNFITIMSLFPQSTNVDWLAVDISRQQKDFAQILELVMWIRAMWFVVGAHVSIHSCDFTNGYFQGHEIDRILLYRIPAEGIREVRSSKCSNFGLTCSRLRCNKCRKRIATSIVNTCKEFKFSLNQILPTLFTLRDDESIISAVVSSNVNDLLCGYLPEGAEVLNSVLQHSCLDRRQTRLVLSYRISKIRSTFENPCVRDLRECNRILEGATSTSTCDIYFSPDFFWDNAVVVTISDASFCQEQEQIDGVTQNSKSQHYSLGSWYRAEWRENAHSPVEL